MQLSRSRLQTPLDHGASPAPAMQNVAHVSRWWWRTRPDPGRGGATLHAR